MQGASDPKMTTPISTLPVEILSSIFIAGTPKTSSTIADPLAGTPFSCVVASICHHWRHTAINLPMLWTGVYMSDSQTLVLPKLFIGRTGGLPLDVFM
ncbi:hypothetical protein HYDPIDRAFT_97367, partial [Hydnomerulius pinastri MD-312]